jgi:hypothetical protein
VTDKHEEQVPGITFWFKKASMSAPAIEREKFRIDLVLDCGIVDETLWEDILKRFKTGFRVFSSNDFHLEVQSVMRQTIQELENKNAELERQLRQKEWQLKQAKEETELYKKPMVDLGNLLRRDEKA